MPRVAALLRDLDKERMRGVEIGPFFSPLAPKRDGWKTVVVDFTDGKGLRKIALTHDSDYIRSQAGKIEDVDIVWNGQDLADACLAINPDGFDFILASHVIEHVPDLVGFFKQAARLLKPDGIVSLAIPDMRRCFDALKMPSGTADVLAAAREKRTRHSPETMFEAWGYSCMSNGQGCWIKGEHLDFTLHDMVENTWEKYQAYLTDYGSGQQAYVDAHAWYFVPASFELIALELNSLGVIDFHCHRMVETVGAEFSVQMRRGRTGLTGEALKQKRTELLVRRQRELLSMWNESDATGRAANQGHSPSGGPHAAPAGLLARLKKRMADRNPA